MDPIIECLAFLNSKSDLTVDELVTQIIRPLLKTLQYQNERITALEFGRIRCPAKGCDSTFGQKQHLTRHVRTIVSRGAAEPLYAEHKAGLDKIDAKKRAAALVDAADSGGEEEEEEVEEEEEEDQFENELRGVVAHPPPPAGVARDMQLPARATPPNYDLGTGHFQYPYNMEQDVSHNLEYPLNITDQAEGLLEPAYGVSFSDLLNMDPGLGAEQLLGGNQGMVPDLRGGEWGGGSGGGGGGGNGGIYPGPAGFEPAQHWLNNQSVDNAPLAYTENMALPHGGGIGDELADPQGYGVLYQNNAQMGEFGDVGYLTTTWDESQQEPGY